MKLLHGLSEAVKGAYAKERDRLTELTDEILKAADRGLGYIA